MKAETWNKILTCSVVAAIIWLAVVVGVTIICGPSTIGAFADGLAPIGSMLTALALLFAFKQRSDDERQRSQDARDAHLDKLANAYAAWFEPARAVLARMNENATEARRRCGASGIISSSAEVHAEKAIESIFDDEYTLATTATAVLLFESDESYRARVLAITKELPATWGIPWGRTEPPHPKTRESVVSLGEAIKARRAALESLFADVAQRLRAGAPVPPPNPPTINEAAGSRGSTA